VDPHFSYVFSAKGAAFTSELGQRPRIMETENTSAESAIHFPRRFRYRNTTECPERFRRRLSKRVMSGIENPAAWIESRFQRLAVLGNYPWGVDPRLQLT